MASSKKITLKLLVDKEKNQLVFAEAGSDMVDILLSFLTFPMGAIVGRMQSRVGCLNTLYQSVQMLEEEYLQTKACRTMLLDPQSEADVRCHNLAISINSPSQKFVYRCSSSTTCKRFSSFLDVPCVCGKPMIYPKDFPHTCATEEGVFVKRGMKFLITDDLQILPASTSVLVSLFQGLGIKEGCGLEERTLEIKSKEVINLLKRSFVSKHPLSDVCLNNLALDDVVTRGALKNENIEPKVEHKVTESTPPKMKVKLILSKSMNKLVYAEVGKEMVDLLFSFLTFPLGSVVKLLRKSLSLGCTENLYKNVEGNNSFILEEGKRMLLSPRLAPNHGCSSPLIKIDESISPELWLDGYYSKEVNPKSTSKGSTEKGGVYTKGSGLFMVTDALNVTPLSPSSSVRVLNELKIPVTDLVEEVVSVGEAEALELLKAAMVSKTALSDVFCSKGNQRMASQCAVP